MAAFNAKFLSSLLEKVKRNEETLQTLTTIAAMGIPLQVAKDLHVEQILTPFAETEHFKKTIFVILQKLSDKKEALKKEEEKKAKRNEQARVRYAKKTEESRKRKAEESVSVSAPDAKKGKNNENKENVAPKKAVAVKKPKQTALMKKCMRMRASIPY